MKRLQLPKNKFARLAINIAFIILWIPFCYKLLFELELLMLRADFNPSGLNINPFLFLIIFFISPLIIPIVLFTKYIWFPKRPKITRSKD
tara:strand:+ start:805 stop:1074 length:270 start_codon:yes stop_codon:yes gene_type:complete